MSIQDPVERRLVARGEILERPYLDLHELAKKAMPITLGKVDPFGGQQLGDSYFVACAELVLTAKVREPFFASHEDAIEKHVLKNRLLHQESVVAVLLTLDAVPVVRGMLDNIAPPEGLLIVACPAPEVATPLEVGVVDVEVMGIRQTAQETGGQRCNGRYDVRL